MSIHHSMYLVAEVYLAKEFMPLITEMSKLDMDAKNAAKDVVSTNPLDIANDTDDSDDNGLPIWMRGSKTNHDKDRPHRGHRQHKQNRRDSDRKERRDSDRKERHPSDRDQRDPQQHPRPMEPRNESAPFWNDNGGGDKRFDTHTHKQPFSPPLF